MNCLRRAIIFRQRYRLPELSCSVFFWWWLTRALQCRSGGHHESGAFLLGKKTGRSARITEAVFYDDLDPQVFDSGIVRFDGRYFGRLWDMCQVQGLTVVADVHTHPGAACQSHSDRAHPMIAKPGHIAIILPQYAAKPWEFHHVGVYRYLGARQWASLPSPGVHALFFLGIWRE